MKRTFLAGFVLLDLQFYVYVLQIVVSPFVFFLLVIVLAVLRFTNSDYPFGIFKLFLISDGQQFHQYQLSLSPQHK
jgi:hypothetical protein